MELFLCHDCAGGVVGVAHEYSLCFGRDFFFEHFGRDDKAVFLDAFDDHRNASRKQYGGRV